MINLFIFLLNYDFLSSLIVLHHSCYNKIWFNLSNANVNFDLRHHVWPCCPVKYIRDHTAQSRREILSTFTACRCTTWCWRTWSGSQPELADCHCQSHICNNWDNPKMLSNIMNYESVYSAHLLQQIIKVHTKNVIQPKPKINRSKTWYQENLDLWH